MLKILVLLGLALQTAASSADSNEPWDLSYLLSLDPSTVTLRDLADHEAMTEEHFHKYNEAEGITFPALRTSSDLENPDVYSNGGDSALFTGFYVATALFRYRVTQTESDLDKFLEALRGLHIVTNISGVPGVVARAAFPSDQKRKWLYPEAWQGRIDAGFVYTSPTNIRDPLDPTKTYPEMIFYTRATRDQYSGVLFGLGTAWALLNKPLVNPKHAPKVVLAKSIVKNITEGLWWHARNNNFKIVDQTGRNDTNADSVTGLLKLQLLAVYRAVLKEGSDQRRAQRIDEKYQDEFKSYFFTGAGAGDRFNIWANYSQYYAWNLRFARTFTIWALDENAQRRQKLGVYLDSYLWEHVKDHKDPFFTFIKNAVRRAPEPHSKLFDGIWNLKALTLRPLRAWSSPLAGKENAPSLPTVLLGSIGAYVIPAHLREPTNYFIWSKPPWRVGDEVLKESYTDSSGLDFLLPYWMGRHYGFINQ